MWKSALLWVSSHRKLINKERNTIGTLFMKIKQANVFIHFSHRKHFCTIFILFFKIMNLIYSLELFLYFFSPWYIYCQMGLNSYSPPPNFLDNILSILFESIYTISHSLACAIISKSFSEICNHQWHFLLHLEITACSAIKNLLDIFWNLTTFKNI